ncbi:MAG: xanthine dehydrogenase family protein molybdopterin-binding subunit, partial [Gemmatimonadota bacterium]
MATTAEPGTSLMGASVRRKEDQRFITGAGHYTDDLKLPGQVYAAFVRSPHANATINAIDASAALAMPGVHTVLTGEDMKQAGVNPIPPGWLHPGIKIAEYRALAVGRVGHVGNAVAVVIADSPTLARDAADAVVVDYADHPAVADAVAALEPGAPQVHPEAPGNVAFTWQLGDAAATDAAMAGATSVVRQHLVNQRLIANAMEPRAAIGEFDRATNEYTLYTTSQNPHVIRLLMGAFV